ncbi:MAG: ferrous iron transport protein B [Candidatus Nezhaarchaeota archaeon]|nr:ferrous iron transport protein B [Candidatus Nezhaarchaeota archaeon]
MSPALTIALAGNANVGKSCIFNQLTGLNQKIGNWPGKTVEKAEGSLYFKGYKIRVIDLPGTYSLSAFSAEEVVTRDFVASREANVVVNVVDASALERNLYLTLQLVELEAPIILALNQVDMAERKGINVNAKRLSELLGVQVVPTVAITGLGLNELLNAIVDGAEGRAPLKPRRLLYGREIENRLIVLEEHVKKSRLSEKYPSRWMSIKLLERDPLIIELLTRAGEQEILGVADRLAKELEEMHGEPAPVVIAAERYAKITSIVSQVQEVTAKPRVRWERTLERVTTHPIMGYAVLALVLLGMLSFAFYSGAGISPIVEEALNAVLVEPSRMFLRGLLPPQAVAVVVEGLITGFASSFTIVLPYIVPFYLVLSILEDSGYLPRAAYLTDSLMHKMGLHGKALIPLLLGFGCNVPACTGCRILETDRERRLCGLSVVFVPCSARTVVILSVVGRFLGVASAITVYMLVLVALFLTVRAAFKVMPGEPVGLIMEMPPYRRPSVRVVISKMWVKTKEFMRIALPIIMCASALLEGLKALNLLEPAVAFVRPYTEGLLGLPPQTFIPLLFGFLRKELVVTLLAESVGTADLASVMTPQQMYVFGVVVATYIPCVATLAALVKEFGWRSAAAISTVSIAVATLMGALLHLIFRALLI